MARKLYNTFTIIMLIALFTFVAYLSGYVVGYNDNYAKQVLAYKLKQGGK